MGRERTVFIKGKRERGRKKRELSSPSSAIIPLQGLNISQTFFIIFLFIIFFFASSM